MSHYDYVESMKLSADDPPFATLIMAAMRKADTQNAYLLRETFPDIIHEFELRYWAPGGYLPGELTTEAVDNFPSPD